MPFLDVTDVLLDPDFFDSLVCTRNVQTVGDDGLATNVGTDTPFIGVVTSDSGDILERMATGSRVKGSILVCTKFRLVESAPGIDADVVTWDGSRYTVTNVNNYSRYGAGFVEAYCTLIPVQGAGNG
ncbi:MULTISPECIES: hypothetical protein [unclassified Achromobacter]|uniref:hypothetical protein n=1 Tax=unclassified Achromobacter TaxID=2626865 RepID=UPI000B5195A1|nr:MULTISPECIES: hypothetical protein [unclassified Achromobacter]OWT69215.1 hypothetical protein CEY05_28730 [Achromobacter sp. HZ34]OWT70620.1 hypothetical protein CEY04_27560 [Achromobacter sp. HZ28]